MAIYSPTPGFKGRMFKLCVLTKWDYNFCVRSFPLRGPTEDAENPPTEDAANLLDVIISLLEEMTDIYISTDVEKDEICTVLLSKITSTMTDRTATMKSFDKKLEEFIKSKIGQQSVQSFSTATHIFCLGSAVPATSD